MFLIAIVFTILFPPIGAIISILAIIRDKKNAMIYSFLIAFVLAIFAYNYQPGGGTDLIRYFENVKRISRLPWYVVYNSFVSGKETLYLYTTECWIIGRFFNEHLLPAISVFGVYFCSFYITCKMGENRNTNGSIIALYILLTIISVNFYYVVNNVRNVFSFMLISVAVFREIYLKKRNVVTLILYFAPLFIHTSAIVFILLRFVYALVEKVKILSLCCILAVEPLLVMLSGMISKISGGNIIFKMISRMVNKGADYFLHSSSHWAIVASNSGSIKYTKYCYELITVIYIIYILVIQKKIIKNKKFSDEKKWNNYIYCIILTTCSMFPMVMPEYWRFAVCIILTGASVCFLDKSISKNRFIKLSYVLGVPLMVLWCRDIVINSDWGYMVSYAFFPMKAIL